MFLMKDEHLRDLVSDGKDRVKGCHGFLEDHGDPFASNGSHLLHGEIGEVNTIKEDFSLDYFSGRLWDEPHDGQGSDGFSATRLADQPKGLPPLSIYKDTSSTALEGLRGAAYGLGVNRALYFEA